MDPCPSSARAASLTVDGRPALLLAIGQLITTELAPLLQVYAISLYVDEDLVREKGFEVLEQHDTPKALILELVRTITSKDFSGALMRTQRPRMRGEEHFVDMMEHAMGDRTLPKGIKGATISVPGGVIIGEGLIEGTDIKYPTPGVFVPSTRLSFHLFDVYLGKNSFTPEALEEWKAGAKRLTESA